jgi:hypothetical protein
LPAVYTYICSIIKLGGVSRALGNIKAPAYDKKFGALGPDRADTRTGV